VPIRILLAQLDRLTRDILERLLDQPDTLVVGHVEDGVEVLLVTGRTQADVVILGAQEAGLPGLASHLLAEYPHLKILAVAPDARRALLYELRPHVVPIGEVSPERLLQVIRAAVRSEVP
jgi:DNA-binding NarL/FixJ family response regulator